MRIDQYITQGIEELIWSDGQAITLEDGRTVAVFSPPSTTLSTDVVMEGYETDIDRTVMIRVGSVHDMSQIDVDEIPVDATLQGIVPRIHTQATFEGDAMRIASVKHQRSFVEVGLKLLR